jgi:hypothetical protein
MRDAILGQKLLSKRLFVHLPVSFSLEPPWFNLSTGLIR